MFGEIGTNQVVVAGLLIVILFGGKKLPELAKGISDAIEEIRKSK